jgi:hypothetical protein
MAFLYKCSYFPKLEIQHLNTKGSVLTASQGEDKFTMVFKMGDGIVVEGPPACDGFRALSNFEERIGSTVSAETERYQAH